MTSITTSGAPRGPASLLGAALLGLSCVATAQTFTVAPELWDRPRSAATVTAVPAVREAASRMIARPDGRLVIRHARAPESLLQAEELRAWLVAHAIESRRIELRADLAPKQPLVLEVAP